MVIDTIKHAQLFAELGPRFRMAFAFLATNDVGALAVGTYEIDGRHVYALVQEYQSRRPADGKWEAHRRYIDLQYVVSGTEKMGFAPTGRMSLGDYDQERDFVSVTGAGEFVTLCAGEFVLLWPGEPHMPGMALGEPVPVRKVVVKIQAD